MLLAMAKFIKLCKDQDKYDISIIAKKLSSLPALTILQKASARVINTNQQSDEICSLLIELYNNGKSHNSRHRLIAAS